jgi:hypothetical protein
MNEILQQLMQLGPGIGAGLSGNGHAMQQFMEGFQRTQLMLQRQKSQQQQDALSMQEHDLRLQDRERNIQRQDTADAAAQQERERRLAMDSLQLPGQLAELGAGAQDPQSAQALIESAMPNLMKVFGQEAMAYGQPAVEMAQATITGRQKKQVEAYVDAALKTAYVADNPDADPELQLPEHVAKIMGRPSAKLSEVQSFAQLPVGKPAGKTRVPAAGGSFEDYVAKAYGENPTAEQILEARKAYNQADDRAPRVTVNTGANDSRINSRIDRLTSSFNSSPLVKEFNEVQAQHQTISQVVNSQWSGPGDMSVVFAFMKALDPNSVVRETEYANAAKSGNIFAGWAARFNGALNPNGGFLSDQVKQDFLRTIEARMGVKKAQYDNLRKQTVQKIDRIKAGAPETGEEAVTDYGAAFPPKADPNASQPRPAAPKRNPFRPQ